MDVRQLLEAVKKDEIDIDTAVNKLKDLPYEDLGYANIDHHRELRNGFPEVIYCEGKTDEHIIGIVDVLFPASSPATSSRHSAIWSRRTRHSLRRTICRC